MPAPDPDDPRPWPDRDEILTHIPEPQRTAILKMRQLWAELFGACHAIVRDGADVDPDRLQATEDFAPALVELGSALESGALPAVYEAAVRVSVQADPMDGLAAERLREPELAFLGGVVMMRSTLRAMTEMEPELDSATEQVEAELGAAMLQAGDRPPQQGDNGITADGLLQPGPDPDADARIDQLVWEAALKAWRVLPEVLDLAAKTELPLAAAMWRASGRAVDWDAFQNGPDAGKYPVYLLAERRIKQIAQRADRGEPLCPELRELKEKNAR